MTRLAILLAALLAAGCQPAKQPIELKFALFWDGAPMNCASEHAGIRLADLRFYVYDIGFTREDGSRHALDIAADDAWQGQGVALLDFEDGTEACLNGSGAMRSFVAGLVDPVHGGNLAFTVGVPEALNHENPMLAAAPLGYTDMHWHWASGYKFLRAAIETGDDGFFVHLGSARCEGTIGDIKGCAQSNRPAVNIADFDPTVNVVAIHLDRLFASVDLGDQQRGECMSGPADGNCDGVFEALGLDRQTGGAAKPSSVFSRSEAQ